MATLEHPERATVPLMTLLGLALAHATQDPKNRSLLRYAIGGGLGAGAGGMLSGYLQGLNTATAQGGGAAAAAGDGGREQLNRFSKSLYSGPQAANVATGTGVDWQRDTDALLGGSVDAGRAAARVLGGGAKNAARGLLTLQVLTGPGGDSLRSHLFGRPIARARAMHGRDNIGAATAEVWDTLRRFFTPGGDRLSMDAPLTPAQRRDRAVQLSALQ